jgi:hypothetical protein
MADRYWVGGTAAWDGTAGTKWSTTSGGTGGAAIPTTADDVFFNASSGASTVTISAGNTGAKSVTCTGFTGNFTGSGSLTVAGSFVMASTMSGSTGFTGTITITGTGTLTTAGQFNFGSPRVFNINAPGGTVTLGGAFINGNSASGCFLTITAGTFDTGANYSVSATTFDASGAGTKTLNLNASTLTFSGSSGGSDIASVGPNTTVNAGTSTINLNSGGGGYFNASGYTFYNFTSQLPSSGFIGIRGGNNTFNQITLTTQTTDAAHTFYFGGGTTTTVGTMVASGPTIIRRIFIGSDTQGSVANLSFTTWATFNNLDFQDIALNSARSGTSIGNCGGCTNITFDAAKTVYWNLTGTVQISAVGWATTSGGSPALGNFPLAQDTLIFDNAGAATSISSIRAFNFGTINLSARTSALTIDPANLRVYGNWINSSSASVVFPTYISGILSFRGNTNTTITSSGRPINVSIEIDKSSSASVTLQDALTVTAGGSSLYVIYLSSGIFNSNNYNVTLSNSTSLNVFWSITTLSKTLAIGTSIWSITGAGFTTNAWNVGGSNLTITGTGTISLISASAKTFAGGGFNYGSVTLNQGGAGALTITGSNTFGNITNTRNTVSATSILFTAGTTNTFANWNANGAAGRLLTIGSVTAASHTLSKASGTVNASFLSISRSNATGGATWNAANSTNGGNNTGWRFLGGGNFMAFFM